MARPKKQTVDYFPHYCKHKITMYILEQKYGNDGYAFWFKLLELLGNTDGHWLELSDEAKWEYLSALTHLSTGTCTEILDLLARLEAIDKELWQQQKIIWSQNFVDGVADAYKNRKAKVPQKPGFYSQKPLYEGISTAGNPQIKLNEIKEDEIKLNQKIDGVDLDLQNGTRPPPPQTKGKGKNNSTKDKKTNYREYVRMTPEEYKMLQKRYGPEQTETMLDILDNYKGSKGRSYKDDYRAILSWVVTRYQEDLKKGVYHGQACNYASESYPADGSGLREFIQNYEPEPIPEDDEMH